MLPMECSTNDNLVVCCHTVHPTHGQYGYPSHLAFHHNYSGVLRRHVPWCLPELLDPTLSLSARFEFLALASGVSCIILDPRASFKLMCACMVLHHIGPESPTFRLKAPLSLPMASPLTRWKFLAVISVPPISRSCGVACRARRGTVTMASPLQQAVVAAGTLAASLSGRGARRKPSEVTLDPKTAECAQTISSVLATVQEPSTDPQMVKDVVQALSAFAKMRVLHTEILRVFRDLPTAAWQDMPSELMVEAIASYAQFQLEDVEFHRFLARILVDRDLSRLKGFELANLAFAAATLELGDLDSGIYPYFQAAFEKANVCLGCEVSPWLSPLE